MITPRFSTHFSRTLLATALATASFSVMQLAQAVNPPASAAANVCFASYTGNTTDFSSADASAVRDAVNAASAGGVVKIAGTCAGVVDGSVVSVTKGLTLRGGYTSANWSTSNPTANPTVLDAQGAGRVISASATTPIAIENLTVQNGLSTGPGGGLYVPVASAEPPLKLVNVQFISNTAVTGGGAYVGVPLIMTDTDFIRNTATAPLGADGGGGMYLFSLNSKASTIFGGVFQQNNATMGGGLLVVDVSMSIVGTQFLSNTARAAAAMEYLSVNSSLANTLSLTSTVFISNTAIDDGSGLFGFGGGLHTNAQANIHIADSRFERNVARDGYGQGGAIEIDGAYATLRVVNTVFARNGASATGDDIYLYQTGQVDALQNTFAARAGAGSALVVDGTAGSTILTNSLFSGYGKGVELLNSAAAVTLNGVLWDSVSTPTSGGATVNNAATGSAGFADAAAGNYLATGAGVDAGVNSGVATDIRGVTRPQGAGYDLGAYEYGSTSTDATLSSLSVNPGTLSPAFVSSTTSYTAEVPSGTTSAVVTATPNDAGASVAYSSTAGTCVRATVSARMTDPVWATDPVAPTCDIASSGTTTITITITAADGTTTKTYTIAVTVAAFEGPHIAELVMDIPGLTPAFVSTTLNYQTEVPSGTNQLVVTPTLSLGTTAEYSSTAGACTDSGTSGTCLLFPTKTTIVTIGLTDGATTRNYTIVATRASAPGAVRNYFLPLVPTMK